MRKGAARVVLAVSLSRLAGLIRERIFAQYLGTSDAADAYGAALRIPTLLESLLGNRIFSSAFIPRYSRLLAEKRGAEAAHLARAVASIHVVIVTGIVAAGVAMAPVLVSVVASGFDPAKAELTVRLVRILFPAIGFLVLGAWCLGVLNSHRRFFLPYIVPILSSAAISIALIATGSERDPADLAVAAAWGALVGAALQLLAQLPRTLRTMEPAGPTSVESREHVTDVGRNALPAAGRGLVSRLGTWVEVAIAGFVSTGALAGLNYAQLLYSLPVGLFTVAVSAALLPELSAAAADPDRIARRLSRQLDSAMRHTAYLLVPSAVVFMALGDVLVSAVYQGGQFRPEDVTWVWAILGASAIGLVGASMGGLQATAFYAIGDARTPLRASLVRLGARAVLGLVLAIPVVRALGLDPKWGAAGLGAAIGTSGWIEFVLLRRWLEVRLGMPRAHDLVPYLIRLWSIAAIAAAVGWAVKLTLPVADPIVRAAAILGPFSAVYVGITFAAGMREPRSFVDQLRALFTAER
jgi:putative peptidoglycan lipid II flippase